jgi:NADH:ubiquinone oxidoreductase subunit 5 (subunit L)/multisubunit Na+/H+ antiporter MnhA subunit
VPPEISPDIASLLVTLIIGIPVATSLLFAVSMAFLKPTEDWERPVARLAMGAMGACLLLVALMAGVWVTGGMRPMELTLPWKVFSEWNIFLYDGISALLSLVATLMGLATIRFSATYLHREGGFTRFMATALLFLGSILGAIFADNPVQMAAWWEFIGASSLLLIGFYHERPGPCSGAVAVLRQYRIADAGMLVGCGLILANEVHGEYGSAALLPPEVRDVAAIGFAVAVLVKSAQLPFSGWLPRAMEGPTPSSALFYGGLSLHVGLLLAVRLHSLWVTSPLAQWMFIVCGGLTAIDAGIRSRVQPDAKTALAWSAMSTVGVMVAMIGVGLWAWVVPLVAGHAVIRWYQLIRSPSQPMDLLWYRKSMGLPLGRVAQTPVAVHAWLLARKLFQVPSEMVGRSLQACRAACRALFPSKVRILSSLLPLFVALAYAWTLSDSHVGMILTIGSGLMVLVMALAPFHVPENRPMLTGAAGACAIAMTGALMASDHDFNSTVLFVGGIVITLSAVSSVLGSDDIADVLSATLKGSTGMALLAQSYGHGIAMGAAVFLALTGILATWLLSSVVARIGPVDWSRLGGVARLAPRFHAGFLLLMGALIGMPPWVSFMLVDGAMESASAFSPWMCLVLAGFWAVVAFRVGRLTMECCWGPPRGLVSDGPIPDLLDREWIPVLAVTLLLGATGLVQSLGITRESWWSPTSPATSSLMKYDQKAMDSLFNFSGFTGCGAPQNMPGCAQSGMGVTPVALCGTNLKMDDNND